MYITIALTDVHQNVHNHYALLIHACEVGNIDMRDTTIFYDGKLQGDALRFRRRT